MPCLNLRVPRSPRRPAIARLSAWLVLVLLPGLAPAQTFTLPPEGDSVVGRPLEIATRYEDTFADIARAHGLGFREVAVANPDVDPWVPGEGTVITLPTSHILPDAPREGIVVNVAEMRLYYYPRGRNEVVTHPIGIGREGWATPTGTGTILDKTAHPSWTPPASIRAEHAARGDILPAVVPPGPANPLGDYAMRLSLPGYLIHGTNRPFGVGMRISHGCIRLYPEDIASLFARVPIGTRVNIVNQPYKAGWRDGVLYVEAHPPLDEDQAGGLNTTPLVAAVISAAEQRGLEPDWERIRGAALEHTGLPVPVTGELTRMPLLTTASQPAPDHATAMQQPPQTVAAVATPHNQDWHLHMGAFRDPTGLEMLTGELTALHIPARVEAVPGRDLQRLVLGPFATAAEAMAARVRVREATGIEPALLPPGDAGS